MKTAIIKSFVDFEKEEKWLNEMAVKGLALTDYSPFRYVFEDCEPGEYTYRSQMLEHWASHPESRNYIRFMEENGAEHVASSLNWVYFRKKGGDFDIFSDMPSRLKHYRRICWLLTCVGLPNVILGVFSIGLGLTYGFSVNITIGCFNVFLGTLLLTGAYPLHKKIKKLKKDMAVME